MSQSDFALTTGNANTGITQRSKINEGLQALAGCSSGATEPTTKYAYQIWADTTSGYLKLRNAANTAWVNICTLAAAGSDFSPKAGPGSSQAFATGALTVTGTLSSSSYATVQGAGYYGDAASLISGGTAGDMALSTPTVKNMVFGISNIEKMRLDSSGNLLVGVTSGTRPSIYKNTAGLAMEIQNPNTATTASVLELNSGAAAASTWNFLDGYSSITGTPSQRFAISGTGNMLNVNNSYGALSDQKLKENIVDARNYLNDLCKVKIRKYSYKTDALDYANQLGVIAQELENIFPGLVEETPDYENIDGERIVTNTTTKSVKYSIFVPMLITAVQGLKAKSDELEMRLAALEAKLSIS